MRLRPNEFHKDFINSLSGWILVNSSSESLTIICNIIMLYLENVGFSHEFEMTCIISSFFVLLNIAVYEDEIELVD